MVQNLESPRLFVTVDRTDLTDYERLFAVYDFGS